MGRAVRRVPADWAHPLENGVYKPLFGSVFERDCAEWKAGFLKWESGEFRNCLDYGDKQLEYWEWADNPPRREKYMPSWSEEEKTHYMMYETTSEGTPLSPAFATPEELARWLVDNGVSHFANIEISYEEWLMICISKIRGD